jgi:cytoskeletal protein CcmA (bactofilin family)
MASRTQIRLQQLTGSLSAPGSLGSEVALASLQAEHLGELLAEMGQAIARIHGEKDFTNKAAGVFGHASQFESTLQVDGAADLKSSAVISGSAEMKSTLAVQGNADFNGELDVQEAANFQKDLSAAGAIAFSAASGASAASDPDVGISGHVNMAKDAMIQGSLEVEVAAKMASAQIEDLTAGRVVLAGTAGEIEDSANLTFNGTLLSAPEASFSTEMVAASAKISDLTSGRVVLAGASGEIEDSANLTFNGSKLIVTGEAQVTSHMDIDGELDAAQAVNFQSTLAVAGDADLNGALDVAGAVDLAASGVLTNIRGTLSVDEAATFDSNVTISGNLTVSGTTTTVNTEEVTIADHNIVLDSNNNLSAIVDGAGFTIEGGTGDDLTFQWSSADSDMELKLGSSFAKLHIGDLAAADAVFSADVSAVSGSFSGDMAVSGDMTAASAAISGLIEAGSADIAGEMAAASIKIDGDTAQRLYIVDADGSMKDEAKLVFDGSKLAITGDEEVSGYMRAAKIEIDSASNYIDTDGSGVMLLNASGSQFIYNNAASLNIAGTKAIHSAGELEFGEYNGTTYTQMLNITGAELQVAGTKPLQFNDADEAIYSDGAKLNLKSGGQNYKLPSSGVQANYVLSTDANGVMSWVSADSAAASTGRKYVDVLSAAVSAGSAFTPASNDYTELAGKAQKLIDIYVNGQLLHANKQTVAATYDTAGNYDASINTADGSIKFAFDLEIDDVVTVIGR